MKFQYRSDVLECLFWETTVDPDRQIAITSALLKGSGYAIVDLRIARLAFLEDTSGEGEPLTRKLTITDAGRGPSADADEVRRAIKRHDEFVATAREEHPRVTTKLHTADAWAGCPKTMSFQDAIGVLAAGGTVARLAWGTVLDTIAPDRRTVLRVHEHLLGAAGAGVERMLTTDKGRGAERPTPWLPTSEDFWADDWVVA